MNLPCPILLCLAALLSAAGACQICVPFPQKSTADFLIEAQTVALAREDPGRPFHLKSVKLLRGDLGTETIDLFLDSSTRRLLSLDPDRSVVVVRSGGDGEPTWQRIGIADDEFGPLVEEILDLAPAWQLAPKLRPLYFCKLLGHDNPQLSSLAHLEVGRAPYSAIRSLESPLGRDDLNAFLKNFRYIEWHSLYILLLAQSEDERDRRLISETLRSAARFGLTLNLAAWATASIEQEGESAIAYLEENYLGNPDRSTEELEAISLALSTHGSNGRTELRDRIVSCYATLLETHPSMTAKVALDLIAWKRRELAAEVAEFIASKPRAFDFKTTLQLRAYGRQATGSLR
jgi:hypothetical protein